MIKGNRRGDGNGMEIRDRAPILLETGDRRKETGDRRQETGDRRQETVTRGQGSGVRGQER